MLPLIRALLTDLGITLQLFLNTPHEKNLPGGGLLPLLASFKGVGFLHRVAVEWMLLEMWL